MAGTLGAVGWVNRVGFGRSLFDQMHLNWCVPAKQP